jgi:hypothetical protein
MLYEKNFYNMEPACSLSPPFLITLCQQRVLRKSLKALATYSVTYFVAYNEDVLRTVSVPGVHFGFR